VAQTNHLGVGGKGGSFGNWMSLLGLSICKVGGIRPGMPPFVVGAAAGRLGFCKFSLINAGRNSNDGIFDDDVGLFAAKSRSAMPPCLYPLVSFLRAYCTLICLPEKYWPFICAIARSEDSKLS